MRAFSAPGTLRGAFDDYRAGRADVAQDEEDKGVLIECPTLVLWGEDFERAGNCGTFVRFGMRWRSSRVSYLSRNAVISRMKRSRKW